MTTNDYPDPTAVGPNPDLRSLDRLVGTWNLSGDTDGTVRFEWLDGGYFLLQHIDMTLHGHHVQGLEVIGHWQPFGEQPGPEIASRAYDNNGNTLDYVYEVGDTTLTIWAGGTGSPSFYRGEFSVDGNINSGTWVYPGGGYQSTMTRKS